MNLQLLAKLPPRWLWGLIATASLLTGGTVFYGITQFGGGKAASLPATPPAVAKITALGRLEPAAEVIKLAVPLSLDGDRVAQVLVKVGDRVKSGQVIAIMDARDHLENALQQAREQVQVAQAKLAQVKAGAKSGEIRAQAATVERFSAQAAGDRVAQQETLARVKAQWAGDRLAQRATIRRLEAELANAQAEYQRYQQLQQAGAISTSLFDSKRLNVETIRQQVNEAQANLDRLTATGQRQLSEAQAILQRTEATGTTQVNEAQATLNQIAEVRLVDIQAAQAEVNAALATVKRAETDLAKTYIRAPMAGQILQVHTRSGEKLSDNGIADLGQTAQMVAVAEVYQTDIGKIQVGQSAIVTGQAFAGEVKGTVWQVGMQVSRQNVFGNQPGENIDRRIVEVKIRLTPEDSQRVANLTNLQVQTAIVLRNPS
jgi:HlyD family secretion protein